MSTSADSSYLESLKFFLPPAQRTTVVLVGCGGTGSWLAPALARLARIGQETGKSISLVFVDPDVVEEKNIYRQNFCRAEIGANKAQALAARYAMAWGVEIGSAAARFGEMQESIERSAYEGVTVICGCVDGAGGRKEIAAFAESWSRGTRVWVDSGNEQTSGQVLAGCSDGAKAEALVLPGFCAWLPLPSEQAPELISSPTAYPHPGPLPFRARGEEQELALSCAEMAMRGAQGLTINQVMAAIMADYIFRIVLTHDLRRYATRIDLASGVMTSEYITRKAINGWLKGKKR
jgi:PRTRC genetic system ThiF family protein